MLTHPCRPHRTNEPSFFLANQRAQVEIERRSLREAQRKRDQQQSTLHNLTKRERTMALKMLVAEAVRFHNNSVDGHTKLFGDPHHATLVFNDIDLIMQRSRPAQHHHVYAVQSGVTRAMVAPADYFSFVKSELALQDMWRANRKTL